MNEADRTIIESLGVYLPPKEVSTHDVVKGCATRLLLPLERLTGIKSRRMAGETEFAYDLAAKAVADCFGVSRHGPDDIDAIVCCNISRYDGPDEYSFEPSTAVKLRDAFGFRNVLTFDITNACAGMFTGIYLVNALIKSGAIRRGLVVSGEYITHLTRTAQKEIKGIADDRIPCLTLGDAGVAVVVEGGAGNKSGFYALELYTIGLHSSLCIAKVTDQAHGGAIMKTDMITLASESITAFMRHAASVAFRLAWSPEMVQHVLPHQTSKQSLGAGSQEIKRMIAGRMEFKDKVIDNVAHRGNTATTSHFVALKDCFLSDKVKSHETVMFGILASGITIGTGMYRLDDLPDRVKQANAGGRTPPARHDQPVPGTFTSGGARPRIRIESIGLLDEKETTRRDTMQMLGTASEKCLSASSHARGDVDLLLSSGVYRTDFLMEPALAALLAGALRMNEAPKSPMDRKTLAFDVINGGIGLLTSCCIATELVRGKSAKVVMIAASEVENNAATVPDCLRGVRETASALILSASPDGETGFGAFRFRYFPEYEQSMRVHGKMSELTIGDRQVARLYIKKDPALEDLYIRCIATAVEELLAAENLSRDALGVVLPPQISPAFISRLADKLGIPRAKFADVSQKGDLFTSSLPYAMAHVRDSVNPARGSLGLIINVAAGIEVGCALYHF